MTQLLRRVGVESTTISRPEQELEIEGSNNHEDPNEEYPTDLEEEVQPYIPIIFVMGVSGAGKSSFIKALGGKDSRKKPPETDPAVSVTREVGVYKTTLDGQEMLLVDTPGFEDNKTSNLEILQKICEYILQVANNPACIIHGAVYVHNVATSRWLAGDERTWAILKALCGDSAMGNVVVATTRWPADHEEEDYEKLEKRNLENYWEGIQGTIRLSKNDVQNSRTVIRMLLGVRPRIFQAQWELSNGNTPSDTSAGRIAITEGEEALSKAEREKEYALAELERVSLQVEPSRDAQRLTSPPPPPPPSAPPPETRGHNAADFKKEMDTLLLRLESAINANKSQLQKIKSSEKTLQEEILQVQTLLREKEDLLKRYHQLRRKIESLDKLKVTLRTLHRPIAVRKISTRNLLAMLVVGGTVVVEIGSMSFPFYGFAACGVMLLYKGVARMRSGNANPTPPRRRRKRDSQASRNAVQTSCTEPQIPTMNIEEGDSQEKGGPAPQEPLSPTAQRRSSWFSFWWT